MERNREGGYEQRQQKRGKKEDIEKCLVRETYVGEKNRKNTIGKAEISLRRETMRDKEIYERQINIKLTTVR